MWKTIILIIVTIICISCGFNSSQDAVSIGDDFIESGSSLSVVDSFSVKLSTILLDSITTSGTTVLWTGAYPDKETGNIASTGYCEIGVPTAPNVEDKDRFDSLMLVMNYSAGYYGDTTGYQTLHVYRLNQELKGDENSKFWNRTYVGYEQNPIGEITFKPKPLSKGTLKIRLSDQIGKEFLQMLKDKDEIVSSFENFREYFMGIALGTGNLNSVILGFNCDTTLNLVLHTQRSGIEKEVIKNRFPLGSVNTSFNHFTADRTGTPISIISKREIEIPSGQSGNKTFVQSGIGLMTRVDFPSMQSLMEMDRKYILLKAELYMFPEPGTYKQVGLPRQLVLFHTDKANRVVSEIVGQDNSAIAAEIQVDEMFNVDTYYKFDITDFLTTEISDYYFEPEHGLLIGETTNELGTSLNRVVFSDRKNTAYKPLVKLYFMYYNL
jgi:hypothetical protein